MLQDLNIGFNQASEKLGLETLRKELEEFEAQMEEPDFWQDSVKAQEVSKQHAKLKSRLQPWLDFKVELNDLLELEELGEDVSSQVVQLEKRLQDLSQDLRFDGPYDDKSAIITITAGAGGTDAADWVQMLQRMYFRFADKKSWKVKLVSETAAEEAGLKNTTFRIEGDNFTYGRLRGEHGVHRLVRLSPFNSGNTRETSFALVEVMPEIDEPASIELEDKDLKIDTFRASGHGGQSVNTTDSAVRITHTPTGITVSMQNEKSQLQNKQLALTVLSSRLASLMQQQHQQKLADIKGPSKEATWGNQIRNYVLHPYKLVKNTDGSFESSDIDAILAGDMEKLIK